MTMLAITEKIVWRVIETHPNTFAVFKNGKKSSTWACKDSKHIQEFIVMEKLKGNDVGCVWIGKKNG